MFLHTGDPVDPVQQPFLPLHGLGVVMVNGLMVHSGSEGGFAAEAYMNKRGVRYERVQQIR